MNDIKTLVEKFEAFSEKMTTAQHDILTEIAVIKQKQESYQTVIDKDFEMILTRLLNFDETIENLKTNFKEIKSEVDIVHGELAERRGLHKFFQWILPPMLFVLGGVCVKYLPMLFALFSEGK